MEHDPQRLRKKAQSLSSAGKPAGEAWMEMREWAHSAGPLAMDIAVQEFLSAYGRDPASARLIPDILHGSAFSPIRAPSAAPSLPRAAFNRPSAILNMSPKPAFAVQREAPGAIKAISVISSGADKSSIRDMPLRMHEGARHPLHLPVPPESRRGSAENQMAMAAAKPGERIIQTLIRHLRSHGRSEVPGHRHKTAARKAKGSASAPDGKKAKAGTVKKTAAKRKPAKKKAMGKKARKRRKPRKR
ncbi:MAG: hypothetical protein AB1295_04475 [Candidatus Micrarchaeota archaeon]